MMNDAYDASAAAAGGSVRELRSESHWRALMADFERWDGTQASFCEARGVSRKTLQGWRRRLGLTAPSAARAGGFVEIAAASADPGWDVELSLGAGVTLRLRRS